METKKNNSIDNSIDNSIGNDNDIDNSIDNDNDIDNDSLFSFDDTWIDDYTDPVDDEDFDNDSQRIKVYFLYIEKDPGTLTTMNTNNITMIKNKFVYYDKCITKSAIVDLIKEYRVTDNITYTLYNIMKYQNTFTNSELEQFLSEGENDDIIDPSRNFLTVYKKLHDIDIDGLSIDIFHRLTSMYFIFIKPEVKQEIKVVPSLKIPYSPVKSERRTRVNKKYLKKMRDTRRNT